MPIARPHRPREYQKKRVHLRGPPWHPPDSPLGDDSARPFGRAHFFMRIYDGGTEPADLELDEKLATLHCERGSAATDWGKELHSRASGIAILQPDVRRMLFSPRRTLRRGNAIRSNEVVS